MADNIFWSAIYLGNFADADTNEGTSEVEDASPFLGTFGAGPGNALANNILTIETDAGFFDDTVTTNNTDGFDFLRYDLGAGLVSTNIDAVMVFDATVTFYDGTSTTLDLGVAQDTLGNAFILALDSQPILASQGIDTITFNFLVNSNYSGIGQYNVDDNTFVCFTSGALIETPNGPKRMDKLRRGDLVTTLDSGPQPVIWIGKRRLKFDTRPHPSQPVVIPRDAMGPNLPKRDLVLSPNHRVLVHTSPARAMHDPLGALAPIKALTRGSRIRALPGKREITYFSLLLARHEVVIANGIAVESLYPGPEVFAALSAQERVDWLRLAKREGRLTGIAPARLLLTATEAKTALDEKYLFLPQVAPTPLKWRMNRRPPLPMHLQRKTG